MSFFFYTFNPDNVRCPKSYILRIFKDDGETKALQTVNVPVKNPTFPARSYNEADRLGDPFASTEANLKKARERAAQKVGRFKKLYLSWEVPF